MDIQDKVIEFVAEQLNISKDEIKPESKILEDLGADSLDVVELLMALEEKFEISIPTEEATALFTVEDVVQIIKTKLA